MSSLDRARGRFFRSMTMKSFPAPVIFANSSMLMQITASSIRKSKCNTFRPGHHNSSFFKTAKQNST